MKKYNIKKIDDNFVLDNNFDNPIWHIAQEITLDEVRVESSNHHPLVKVKLLYNKFGFFIKYDVDDNYIRIANTKFQDSVCRDSCVEFFVEPTHKKYYINFEINAGGTMLCSRVFDPRKDPKTGAIKHLELLKEEEVLGVKIFHTMPSFLAEELAEKKSWSIMAFFPFELFELENEVVSNDIWRGNFYKCADLSSHNHWLSYNPVSTLNFHLPDCFGELIFE